MVFLPPCWVSDISPQIPARVTVGDFVLDGRRKRASVRPPLVDASTGRTCTTEEIAENVDILAAALQQDLGWSRDDENSAEANVVGVVCLNSIDFLIVCWAVHRIGGTCLLIQPTTSVPEIMSHMEKAQCKALVVCEELLPVCKQIFDRLPKLPEKIYSMTESASFHETLNVEIKSLAQLLTDGRVLEKLPNRWMYKGDTFNEIAYLCSTSGTSGRQRLAKITHANVISNILQVVVYEAEVKADTPPIEVALGVLPLSHGFGLVSIHSEVFRGNTSVLHSSFNMQVVLKSIQDHRIERLYLVPPVVAALANNPILFQLFDLSSIREIVMGAAACSDSLSKKMHALQPTWKILAGYGLTECVSPVTLTPRSDIAPGSSGLLLPSVKAILIDAEGREITDHEVPGELYLQSPTQIPGYLGESEEEDAKFLVNGWLPTGDIGFFRKGTNGNEHLFLVDRVKDMIKVKGLQVSPSAIENVLRLHPAVSDAAIVGVEDELAGERPLAFVVATNQDITDQQHKHLLLELDQYVQSQLDESHWLRKRTFLVEELPKTAAGKVLKKKLRDAVKRYNLKAMESAISLKIDF
ncbi:putative NRPS-like protein biosynthetic cluster [Trichoderma asperellum]|uniref:AMP-dependent synthetase/ligase domain-containing protein n=1 Tax=Trichoderma asperellum (strain ATCC 204424 / CBS 433.97 / NBRC 101777) TaxID=1042311 RepID=A0A2T3YZL7_TRIA4|nr:hypothetical protein M441DRAFT_173383 [Trichoderma asperellum CBS 433.97]PTB37960.1 hypothetical protein M441DRAFT_173383 [Trichoderma asperellum CBS 433.97]UKZ97167.1 putative NRPS-like protein biosynthetic cluster [Trichoderma asperellum]